MRSRRLMLDTGLSLPPAIPTLVWKVPANDGPVRSVYLGASLPRNARQVLETDLDRSVSEAARVARCAGCYSNLRPSLLTNARHLPSSRSMLAAYSSGVLGIGPQPSEIRRILTSSELTIWRSSLLRRSTIAGDVPAGASSP